MNQKVTQKTVELAMHALQKQRQFVTVRGIRDTLGCGSFSTISKYLKKIDEERKASQPSDPQANIDRMRILSKLLLDIGTSVELAQEMSRDGSSQVSSLKKITRLCYISRSEDHLSDEELLDIIKESRQNNRHREISGCLLYSNKQFLQVLEGRPSQVMALFQDICEDPRNFDNQVLHLCQSSERFFESWSMICYKPSCEDFQSFCEEIQSISKIYSNLDRTTQYESLFLELKRQIQENNQNLLITV